MQPHRVAVLDDLGIGDAGVGHVGVDTAGAVKAVDRTAAATNGLVVAEGLVAKAEVVHGALAAARH